MPLRQFDWYYLGNNFREIFMLESLPLSTIAAMLDTLPVDLTFMDEKDRIVWFSGHRIFNRPAEIIGRDVRLCHKESSRPAIDKMIADFKSGASDLVEHFTDKSDGRKIRIRYMAVRDALGDYLGMVEMADDITSVRPSEPV
ncbi:hypothetical protein JP09_004790 [Dehalogenimonas etheniformans]|uniref:PAS domain-containing protein n=2 Tax=Dehalogenimonas etheniformans TaxID=1536648 RepID=A0A2P5P755_9CHLR|nr:hypothetical protein JP09_004790 [Dehalogenimonas etheniformans]